MLYVIIFLSLLTSYGGVEYA